IIILIISPFPFPLLIICLLPQKTHGNFSPSIWLTDSDPQEQKLVLLKYFAIPQLQMKFLPYYLILKEQCCLIDL
ncbi:hypothetical protein M5D96_011412, partial [Drosophila gunungcola]